MRRFIHCLALLAFATISLAAIATPRQSAAQCPTVTIECPAGIALPRDPLTFTANINGGDINIQPTFKWTISAGTIISGQGTPTITVDTTGLEGGSVTVTVEISGTSALTAGCHITANCTRQIAGCVLTHRKFDEYGDISSKDEKKRLDTFAIQLENEPGMLGILVVYGGRRAKRGDAEARANRAKDYLVAKHGLGAERILTVTGGNIEESTVELWIGVPGESQPTASRTDAVEPRER
jgi:hypothetical protein